MAKGSALCKHCTQQAREEGKTFHINLFAFVDTSDQLKVSQ